MVIVSEKVLITYASRYGSTKDIAIAISKVLEDHQFINDVFPAEDISSLDPYHAVIMGSAVYFGNWLEPASELLESFQEQLIQIPVWLFSSGPTVNGDPSKALENWCFPTSLQAIANIIRPRDIKLFAGKIDPTLLTLDDWLTNRSMGGKSGDYRDWNIIAEWANSIANNLKSHMGNDAEFAALKMKGEKYGIK